MSEPIRVAVYAPLGIGGVTSLMINIQELIDREKINFDYLVIHDRKELSEDRVINLGSKKLVASADDIKNRYLRTIVRFFRIVKVCKLNNVKILHYNGGAPYGLITVMAAKFGGVKYVTFHSHNGDAVNKSWIKSILNSVCKTIMPVFVDDFWACSSVAAYFSFPKRVMKDCYIMHNAIDLDKFGYDCSVRDEMRKELGLEGKYVIGHAGRFNKQKNHEFLIDIFNEIHKRKQNTVLFLCGGGELEEVIKEKVSALGIQEAVIFYGTCDEMHKMYQAWDVFLMPSLFEGLPVAGIEAQAAGLPVVFSDVVTKEAAVLDCVDYVPLSANAEIWSDTVLKYQGMNRYSGVARLREKGFDQYKMAAHFQKYYLDVSDRI